MNAFAPVTSILSQAPQQMQEVWNNYMSAYNNQANQAVANYDRDMAAWSNRMGLFGSANALTSMGEGRGKLQGELNSGAATAVMGTVPAILKMMSDSEEARNQRTWASGEAQLGRSFSSDEASKQRDFANQQARNEYALQLEYADRLRKERVADYIAGINAYRQMNPNWNYDPVAAAMNQAAVASAMKGGGGAGGAIDPTANDPWWNERRKADADRAAWAEAYRYAQVPVNQGGPTGAYGMSAADAMERMSGNLPGPDAPGFVLPPEI